MDSFMYKLIKMTYSELYNQSISAAARLVGPIYITRESFRLNKTNIILTNKPSHRDALYLAQCY